MDTSGYYPQLGEDDPLFEIAAYTQLMKTKLETLQHAEFTGSIAVAQNTSWGTGALTKDAAYSPDGGLFTSPGNDKILLPERGLYSFHVRLKMNVAAAGTTWASLTNDSSGAEYTSYDFPAGYASGNLVIPNIYVPAATTLKITFITGAAGVTLTSRVRVTKLK